MSPSLTPGVWYLEAIMNDKGVVSDSNEGNNHIDFAKLT